MSIGCRWDFDPAAPVFLMDGSRLSFGDLAPYERERYQKSDASTLFRTQQSADPSRCSVRNRVFGANRCSVRNISQVCTVRSLVRRSLVGYVVDGRWTGLLESMGRPAQPIPNPFRFDKVSDEVSDEVLNRWRPIIERWRVPWTFLNDGIRRMPMPCLRLP